jgi:hypothetical protein
MVIAAKRLLADIGGLAVISLQAASFFTGEFIDTPIGHAEVLGAVVIPVVALVIHEAAVGDFGILALMVVATGRFEAGI